MQKSVQVGLLLLASASGVLAQQPITFQYFYDDLNQLVKVVDSTGVVIQYENDPLGNLLQIIRSTAASGTLTLLNVALHAGPVRETIRPRAQCSSTTPSINIVTLRRVPPA